jgi:CDP-6-deoxy-D-xylo-4-hexulose-3-dehydrase
VVRIPLASSGLRQKDIERLNEVLASGNVTMGEQVRQFETKMAGYLGIDHFVMLNSGSSANLAIFEALLRPTDGKPMLKVGDEVLVPAIAWPTTIWPIIQLGLKPIFCDVNRDNYGLDIGLARSILTDSQHNIRAIFPIHPLGYMLESQEIHALCKDFELVELYDTCEALGAFRDGAHAGSSGIASSYSFYFSHHLTTMEGGGVATNSSDLANDLRSIRSHGWSRDRSDAAKWSYGNSSTDQKFTFVSTGFNLRPMEIQGAVGLSQLTDLDSFIERRRFIASKVKDALKGSALSIIEGDASDTLHARQHSRMLIGILDSRGKERKERTRAAFEAMGIETRPPLTGNFLAQPAAKQVIDSRFNARNFKNAQYLTDNSFLIGCHHEYTESQIEYLTESIYQLAHID